MKSIPLFPDPALPGRVVNSVFEVEDGGWWFGKVFMSPALRFWVAGNSSVWANSLLLSLPYVRRTGLVSRLWMGFDCCGRGSRQFPLLRTRVFDQRNWKFHRMKLLLSHGFVEAVPVLHVLSTVAIFI